MIGEQHEMNLNEIALKTLDLSGSGQSVAAGYCVHFSENSHSIKTRNSLTDTSRTVFCRLKHFRHCKETNWAYFSFYR